MSELLNRVTQEIKDFYDFETLCNPYGVSPAEIRNKHLDKYSFQEKRSSLEVVEDVTSMLRKWTVHVTSPNYFGLFNPSVTIESIVADALVGLYNPQLAVWSHAPAANEIEQHVLNFLGQYIYEEQEKFFACFSTGGSEANMSGILAGLTFQFEGFCEKGLAGISKKPVIYISKHAHHSFEKISKSVGLGESAVRRIPSAENFQMDINWLESQYEEDIKNGLNPFLVVGTAGTTSFGTIDPLESIAQFCQSHNLWFHADAAWGGAALLSDDLKHYIKGIEQADSVTIDAHKWFSVGMGAGMFFTKHINPIRKVFSVKADYMPNSNEEVFEPYITSIQWSRRFIGLKLFMTMATLGVEGVVRHIEKQAELGKYLKDRLKEAGWTIINDTPLPVVCFSHNTLKQGGKETSEILSQVYKEGKYWISDIQNPGGNKSFRACITSFKTSKEHIDKMVADLTEKIS